MRPESQNKEKNTSPPLAVREKSDKFLFVQSPVNYTIQHNLREALCLGFFSISDNLLSLKRPK